MNMKHSSFYKLVFLTLLAGVLFLITSCSDDEKEEAVYAAGFNTIKGDDMSNTESTLIWNTYANAFRANGLKIDDSNGTITLNVPTTSPTLEERIKTGCEEAESELVSREWNGYYEYAIVGLNSKAQSIVLYSISFGSY